MPRIRCVCAALTLVLGTACGDGDPPKQVEGPDQGSRREERVAPGVPPLAGPAAETSRAARSGDSLPSTREAEPEQRREAARLRVEERRAAARVERERYDTPEEMASALEDRDPEVRIRAARRLDAEGEELVVLLGLMSDDPAPEVREAAARGLAAAEDPLAEAALVVRLDDPHPDVVVAAIESLVFVGDESLIPMLEPLLQHKDEEVRLAAEDAIYHLAP